MEVLTDFPERFEKGRTLYVEASGDRPVPVVVENAWAHKGLLILKFSGIDSIDQANRLRGSHILIPQEERTALPDHRYYLWELKGCRVVREPRGEATSAVEVGTVVDVEPTGGVDILRVESVHDGHSEVLIPLAQSICKRIDIKAKVIVIDPPEDLLELNS